MRTYFNSHVFAVGLATFSMFFGAGNIVFPLALGQYAQDKSIFAIFGLLITAVGVPFLGLASMALYDGDYKSFFRRIGAVPGFCLTLLILSLLGPFGATPRCITLSYAAAKNILPAISPSIYSLTACVLIFLCTYKKNKVIPLLGYYLTPLLLASLAVIIVMGFASSPDAPTAAFSGLDAFITGLNEGYQTMDLLAAFFFSSIIITSLKKNLAKDQSADPKHLLRLSAAGSCIGASLLSLTYIGFCLAASFNSPQLEAVPKPELLGTLAFLTVGPYAGLLVCACVTLATLTTAIALASIFAEFLHKDVLLEKISYRSALMLTLGATFAVSTLNFEGIASLITPLLEVCYPALIALCVANMILKSYQFRRARE